MWPWTGIGGRFGGDGDLVWESFLLVGTVAASLAATLVLVTGHVSARVVEGGWPRYRAVEIPVVLWEFVADPLHPGDAWAPVNRGARVPGTGVWWATCAGLVVAAGVPAGVLGGRLARGGIHDAAGRWATRWDLRRLRPRRQSGRLVVGVAGVRRVAVESRHSLLVFGPTQSGKTTGLAVPAILEWPGPVVATSTKGDLVDDTIGWRRGLGRVHVFDPAQATQFPASGWTPLAGCDTWRGATQTAWDLAMAGKAAVGGGMVVADFWFSSAAKSLAPYLYAAARGGLRIDDVARWVDREEQREVLARLTGCDADAALALEATFRRDDRARSSLFQVMQQILGAYLDPEVAASAERSEIVAESLVDGGVHTLYITAPHHDQARFRPLFTTLVGQVIGAVYNKTASTGVPLAPPLLLVLDEAANIAPVEDLPTVASTAAALGLQVVTIFQDLAQVRGRYGQAAGTVVNNHRAKVFLSGVSDLDTLDLLSRLTGEVEVERDSITTDLAGRCSTTTGSQWRRLLPVERARQLTDGRAVLLYGNVPPVRLRLRPWYRSRRLTARAKTRHTGPTATAEPTRPPEPALTAHLGNGVGPPQGPADRLGEGLTALEAARARLRLGRSIPTPGGDR